MSEGGATPVFGPIGAILGGIFRGGDDIERRQEQARRQRWEELAAYTAQEAARIAAFTIPPSQIVSATARPFPSGMRIPLPRAVQTGAPAGTGSGIPSSGAQPGYSDLALRLVAQIAALLRQRRLAQASARAQRRYFDYIRALFARIGGTSVPYPNTSPIQYLGGPYNVPGATGWNGYGGAYGGGGYWGSRPGLDIGDIWGPNSALCNLLGIGCGSGGEQGGDVVPWTDPGLGDPMRYPQVAAVPGGCGSPFRAGGAAASLRASLFAMPNPATGRLVWFRPAGVPVLFSGDLSACKRVARIARRAKRRSGGR